MSFKTIAAAAALATSSLISGCATISPEIKAEDLNVLKVRLMVDTPECRLAFVYAVTSDKTGAEKLPHQNELNEFLKEPEVTRFVGEAFFMAVHAAYIVAGGDICDIESPAGNLLASNAGESFKVVTETLKNANLGMRPATAHIDIQALPPNPNAPKTAPEDEITPPQPRKNPWLRDAYLINSPIVRFNI